MLLPSGKTKKHSFIFMSLVLAILLGGALSSLYVYVSVDRAGREHILDRANTVATSIPLEHFTALSGTLADLEHPSYQKLKDLLSSVQKVNRDVRFLYLLGKNQNGELFFYVDSEHPDSEDYSPPGEVYFEATPAMYAFFADGKNVVEGPDQDRWGFWISGYAPLQDSDGRVLALVGIDLPAEQFIVDVLIYSALPLLVALLLITLLAAAERVREKQRVALEEREEFLSIASHEIRTPLTGIRWATESMLKDPTALPEQARILLTLMHDNAVQLITRINNLLDVSAINARGTSALRKETLDVDTLFADIFTSLTLTARERHLTFSGPKSGGATFYIDRQMMHQAFFNLISNAVKYTRENTEISVSYRHTAEGHELSIRDHGTGIPPDEQKKIFDGYHRADAAVKGGMPGTGLGLFLTKKAIELHGGSITVESKMGEGTTFVVLIP